MKTREDIYGKEAKEILRVVTSYHHIKKSQLLKLFPNKESKAENLLAHFIKQGRIFYDRQTDLLSDGSNEAPNYETLSAIWVLMDFLPKTDYHSASDFPVSLVFSVSEEIYEVVYIAAEKEAIMSHALSQTEENNGKRIVIAESKEQIKRLNIPYAIAYCTVDIETGEILYFTKK